MKTTVLTAAAVTVGLLTLTPVAHAGDGPGCGWGEILFKGQSGLFAHTSAATTNGTSYNQWFGITSGTAGCDPNTVVSREREREVFVASNMDNLSRDMAQGRGAHLDALASLYDIVGGDRNEFFTLTQENLPLLLDAAQRGTSELLAALDSAMAADPALAKYRR